MLFTLHFRNDPARSRQALDGEVVDRTTAAVEETTDGRSSSSPANNDDVDVTGETTSGPRRPSLFRCLMTVYGLSLLKAHFCKLIYDILMFVGPVLQR